MEEKYQLNDGHILEAVDRIHVSLMYLESALAEHPLIHSVEEFEEEVQKAMDILADLYQTIGKYEDMSSLAKEHKLGEEYEVL